MNYREQHEAACKALEAAKSIAGNSFQIDNETILFRKVNKDGSIRVGYKNFESGENFRMIPMAEVRSRNINVDMLPEYTEFSRGYYELTAKLNQLFSNARFNCRQAIGDAKGEYLRPFYERRRQVYDAYMASHEWWQKREECYKIHGTTCVDCQAAPGTDIHHRHYETLGDENPETDIVPLCSACHKARHDNGDLKRKPTPAYSGQSIADLSCGDLIEHDLFGSGQVVCTEMRNGIEAARIRFDTEGEKVLILKYSNIKKVS